MPKTASKPDARTVSNMEIARAINDALSQTADCAADVRLAPASAEDLPFLLETHRLSMRQSIEARMGWDERFQTFRIKRSFDPEHLLILEFRGERIGTVTLTPRTYGRHLDAFYLRPGWQGRGLGGAILRALLRFGDERGWEFRLGVIKGSRARALYERFGFAWVKASEHEDKMRRLSVADTGG